MTVRNVLWRTEGRRRQEVFRAASPTISDAARSPTDDVGDRNPYLLTVGLEDENLYPSIRGDDGAANFFKERGLKWWRSTRSGDDTDVDGPTRNMASSQIACVNFLLPLADYPDALVALLRELDDDVDDVVTLEYRAKSTGKQVKSLVELEWVGVESTLEEAGYQRGAYASSVDALLVAALTNGRRRAYLFEWKYVEEYRGAKYKGAGKKGETRFGIYRKRYEVPSSPFDCSIPIAELFYDPFYQLMRFGLLGQKMIEEEEFGLTEAKVVVVCPVENEDYCDVITSPELAARFPQAASVAEVLKKVWLDPKAVDMTTQADLLEAVRAANIAQLGDWAEYQEARYG